MDGWMDGWMDRWDGMDGMNAWMDGWWIRGCTHLYADARAHICWRCVLTERQTTKEPRLIDWPTLRPTVRPINHEHDDALATTLTHLPSTLAGLL